LIDGTVQLGLLYMPQLRPGLVVEELIEEALVLVASWPNPTMDMGGKYVFVDWGPEFFSAHSAALPGLTNPGLTFSLGAMVAEFIVNRQAAAYLPARYVKKYLDSGQLHLVPDAPCFPYPVWAVWREDLDPVLRDAAKKVLRQVGDAADKMGEVVAGSLRKMGDDRSK
jgi:DNA-binding transcriptional LysR family regulator